MTEEIGNLRNNIKKGLKVSIETREDRKTGKLTKGVVKKILTNSEYHPYGIMVELGNNSIGRVKKIHNQEEKNNRRNKKGEKIFEKLIKTSEENNELEFKKSILWSSSYSQKQINNSRSKELHKFGKNASKVIIAKSIAGFLNTNGGNLIIGIKENKKENENNEIIGIKSEFEKLQDLCKDGYKRMIIDDVIRQYFPSFIFNHLDTYIKISFKEKKDKILCWIKIAKSDEKVFLNLNNEDHFFIRIDSETREISGKELVDYCSKRFKN